MSDCAPIEKKMVAVISNQLLILISISFCYIFDFTVNEINKVKVT